MNVKENVHDLCRVNETVEIENESDVKEKQEEDEDDDNNVPGNGIYIDPEETIDAKFVKFIAEECSGGGSG